MRSDPVTYFVRKTSSMFRWLYRQVRLDDGADTIC
jgi:hypothetical protein